MLQNKFESGINEYIWIGKSAHKRDISGLEEKEAALTLDISPLIKVPTIRIAELAKSTVQIIDATSSKFRYSFMHTLSLVKVSPEQSSRLKNIQQDS